MKRSLVFGIVIAVVASACTHAGPGVEAASRRDTSPRPGARGGAPRWVRAAGSNLRDEAGAPVHLSGLVSSNEVWGRYVWPISDEKAKRGDDPMIRDTVQPSWVLTDDDFARLGGLPGNVVRYEITHELFADDNPERLENLRKLVGHVERFAKIGLGVIVDLNLPIGLDGQSDNAERKKPGAVRERTLFEDDGFFAATVRLWTFLARQLASEPTLVAYELYNEPRAPSEADGGIARFQRRSEELAKAIRAVDPRHLVLVPEYNSREANPGESYPDPQGGNAKLIDHGEQGVRWDHGLVKVDVDNVGYVFHMYDPWAFVAEGARDFSRSEVEAHFLDRVRWRDQIGRAPLVVTEYGINQRQPLAMRVAWLSFVHGLLRAHDIGATYFNYKTAVSPWAKPDDQMALYGQFVSKNETGDESGGGAGKRYTLHPEAARAAAESGFDKLLTKWFDELDPSAASLMGNDDIVAELRRFAQGRF